jgi:hypothetical protein
VKEKQWEKITLGKKKKRLGKLVTVKTISFHELDPEGWLFHDPNGAPLVYFYEKRDAFKPSRYFRRCWKKSL